MIKLYHSYCLLSVSAVKYITHPNFPEKYYCLPMLGQVQGWVGREYVRGDIVTEETHKWKIIDE